VKKSILSGMAIFLAAHLSTLANAGNRLQPHETMRAIEQFQDSLVAGDTDAMKYSIQLMSQFQTDVSATSDEDIVDPKNILSIVVYLLSGGNFDIIETKLRDAKIEHSLEALLAGALAFSKGDKETASEKLTAIEAEKLPVEVRGRLLLIQAILISEKDSDAALLLLKRASASMPGSIVDEAALRRCTAISSKLNNFKVFDLCASRMIRNFQTSPYWFEFSSTFENFAAALNEEKEHIFSGWLVPILENEKPSAQMTTLLSISKNGLLRGNFSLANLCASRAGLLSPNGSPEFHRAMLYSAAALIGLYEVELASVRIGLVNSDNLDKDDRSLMQKVRLVSQHVSSAAVANDQQNAATREPILDDQIKYFDDLVSRAKTALKVATAEELAQ
jgi:chemotaxis protein MotC